MSSPAQERIDRLRSRCKALELNADKKSRFLEALYILQGSLSFDALLTFWDRHPWQATFDADPDFLDERLVILESLHEYVAGNDASLLQLPDCDKSQLPFMMKQFILATCKSLRVVTLGRVPMSCIFVACDRKLGKTDDKRRQFCADLQNFVKPCLPVTLENDMESACNQAVSVTCGDDHQSLEATHKCVLKFWEAGDPETKGFTLQCLLLRAALRQDGDQSQPTHTLGRVSLKAMRQACLSYKEYWGVEYYLDCTRILLSQTKLSRRSHAAWSRLWSSDSRPIISQQGQSCWPWRLFNLLRGHCRK